MTKKRRKGGGRERLYAHLQSLKGYRADRNHGTMLMHEATTCVCGGTVTHLGYVSVGTGYGRQEPLPLCADCYELHQAEESRSIAPVIVPSRAQSRFPDRRTL